jgi:hypothetical protein
MLQIVDCFLVIVYPLSDTLFLVYYLLHVKYYYHYLLPDQYYELLFIKWKRQIEDMDEEDEFFRLKTNDKKKNKYISKKRYVSQNHRVLETQFIPQKQLISGDQLVSGLKNLIQRLK